MTGVAPTIAEAQQRADRLATRITIPNVRYRSDIGANLMASDFARLEQLGVLSAVGRQ